jgi:ATP-binding cassette subfamily B protein
MSFRSLTADQSVKNQKLRPGTLKRIASFAVPYKASLTLFLITVVIDAFLIVATPLLLRRLIDEGVIPKNTELQLLMLCLVWQGDGSHLELVKG